MEHGRNNQQQDQQQTPPPPQRRVKPPEMAANTNQNHHQPNHQPPPPQNCPRCDSSNTKFCYYNNYSLSQPRYFCKACRRYWTQGGTLRNVPVGGGCRKSKRPKPSNPSSSAAGETSRAGRSLPPAAAMITGQVRSLPPQMVPPPSMGGGSLFGGGAFLSSLAAMQSLPGGINQGPPATANLGGATSQFGANMALLQGLNLPPFKPPAPENLFPPQNESFSSQQRPPVSSWTQSFINRGGATSSSAAGAGFWSGGAAESGDNQAASSSSFNPNYWPADNNPGFDPRQ